MRSASCGALRVDEDKHRRADVLRGRRYGSDERGIAVVLTPAQIAEAGIGDAAEIVVEVVPLGAQAILGAGAVEVRLDAGVRQLGMEGGEDQATAAAQGGERFRK